MEVDEHEGVAELLVEVELVVVEEEVERERGIYMFPWLQVRITGPTHHLTSSLQNYAEGYDKTGVYSMFSSMASRVRCLVWSVIREALFLLSFARFVGEVFVG